MKIFFRKKDNPRPTSKPEFYIKLTDCDLEALQECDVALKFRVPEQVERKIDEMCSFVDTSASDLIRQILFIHLYGRYELFGLIERQNTTYNLNPKPATRFNRVTGKVTCDSAPVARERNIADVKVWIPQRMKEDIQSLAEQAGKKVSVYVRETISTHLFGHAPPKNMPTDVSPQNNQEEAFSST